MPLILLLSCLLLAAFAPARAAPPAFALDEVAPGIFLHRGVHADIDDPARADSANLAYVEGARCLAVIDTGGAVATGKALLAAIRARSTKPICYVINTHVHFDHVLGNAAFVDSGAQFVGHRDLVEAIDANRDYFAEQFAAELGGSARQAMVIAPTLTVESTLELDLGERVLELTAHPLTHTATDVSVRDRQTGTLFTGDLLFRERLPVIDGSLLAWLDWMTAAMAETHALVIPGHGPADHDWPAGARAQQAYFVALRDAVRAAVAAGEMVEDAPEKVAAAALAGWQHSARAHRINVGRAYRELEWE